MLVPQAVLRYLIRVFEIKGGSGNNHALLIGGSPWNGDANGKAEQPPVPTGTHLDQPAGARVDHTLVDTERQSVEGVGQQDLVGGFSKMERKERNRGFGLIVHRTREVRFQCHHCGHFYSWEKSIRLHYARVHHETLPNDQALYILPWERKRCVHRRYLHVHAHQVFLSYSCSNNRWWATML